jgi:Tol biopolymer transport system component
LKSAHYLPIFAMLLILSLRSAQAADTPVYFYGYIDGSPDLHLINLANPDQVLTHPIPLRERGAIQAVYPSPDGRKLALIHLIFDVSWLSIYDILSGEVTEIRQYPVFMPAFYGAKTLPFHADLNPLWSPDSTILAFNLYSFSEYGHSNSKETYIYNTASGALTLVRRGDAYSLPDTAPVNMRFSPDSSTFLLVYRTCHNLLCSAVTELYDVTGDSVVLRKALSDERRFIALGMSSMCIEGWSPDARYLALYGDCEPSSLGYFAELYIWDLVEDTVIRITHNTNLEDSADGEVELIFRRVKYSTHWVSDSELLINEAGGPLSKMAHGGYDLNYSDLKSSTMLYSLETRSGTVIDRKGRFNWTANPVSGLLAFNEETYTGDAAGIATWATRSVEIAAYTDAGFLSEYSSVNGCNPTWSPDGRYLQYTVPASNRFLSVCHYTLDGLVFIDTSIYQTTQFVLPESALSAGPDYGDFFLVGWIAQPN